jgi:hypothetical protein
MMRRLIAGLLVMLLLGASSGYAQKNAPAGKQKSATSFTEKVLKFLGISSSPGTLKSPHDEVASGQVWVADLQGKTTRALTSSEGYRSPIFLGGSKDVLAIRASEVIRLTSAGGVGKSLYSVDGIIKLVGVSSEDATKVLILLRGEATAHPRVAVLTISTGVVAAVPYDPASGQDAQMVEDLTGWSRTYGDQHVYVQRQHKQALSGTVEWHDVFLQVDSRPPMDVSQCDGDNCGQPSVSLDGHWLVFVRAKTE